MQAKYIFLILTLGYNVISLSTTLTPQQAAQREKEAVHALQTQYLKKLQEAYSANTQKLMQDLKKPSTDNTDIAIRTKKAIDALYWYNVRNSAILSALLQALDPKSLIPLNQEIVASLDSVIKSAQIN